MSLCHLHNVEGISVHSQKILEICDGSISLDVNSVDSVDEYDIYLLELQNLDKELSLKINKIFEKKNNPLIYLVVLKDYNLILFQLAILLGVKYLITQNQDTSRIIEKIKTDITEHKNPTRNVEGKGKKLNISHRLSFVELLKNELVDKSTINNKLSIITIGLSDEKRLQEHIPRDDVEKFLFELLYFMEQNLKKRSIFSQYDRDFYVALFENIEYEEMKKIAYDFYAKCMQYIVSKDIKLLIDMFSFNLEGLEFSEILSELENIQNKDIDKTKTQSYIKLIGDNSAHVTELSQLSDTFDNSIEFELFNIYNGLCIHTNSHILKVADSAVYVKFEQLQGLLMGIEKRTTMQSSTFLKDIQADVKFIDKNKKIALLENFRFLDTNANARKYSRVTPFGRMPLTLFLDGSSLNGNVIDLSIKSVAFKAKDSKLLQSIQGREAKVVFNIPNEKEELGYLKLVLDVNIKFSTKPNGDGLCKVVCDFIEESLAESVLMEYVYERQKELIIELKKMVKLQ